MIRIYRVIFTSRSTFPDLSDILFLCPKQITRIIQREYGCSLSALIHRQRMESACALLRQTDLEINEICHRIGYENENYFYVLFKKKYGVTPPHIAEIVYNIFQLTVEKCK